MSYAKEGSLSGPGNGSEGKKAGTMSNLERYTGLISMRRVNLVLFWIAVVALILLQSRIDWHSVLISFSRMGASWPLLFIPYGFTCYFWTLSWRFLLVGKVGIPPMHRLFFIRLAGDSLNQLTPTGFIGGEPFKAERLHACGLSWEDATTSLLIQKALLVLSLVVYVLICFLLIPVALPGISQRLALFSSLGTMLLGISGILFVIVQRRNPCISFLRFLQRMGICPVFLSKSEAKLASIDASLAGFYREHPGAVVNAFFFMLLGWLTHSLEVYLIFRLLGHPIDFTVALCLDALSQLVAGLGFMIPASLGVQDGGNILLSVGFSLGAPLGAGFSILRRFREAFWLLLGLLVVAREK
jgi:glycosyltransferase 2 family protein